MIRKILKFIGISIGLLAIIIGISFINHRIQLSKEDELFVSMGEMIRVNDHNIHIYSEGSGDDTLVFMSGGGTSSPVLDFKSLYSLMSDNYKVVVLEKAGYGFSDITTSSRDIHTILKETREALSKANIQGPFVLFPHSMSGIEALYWAQEYPDEVKGIVGLDMAVPDAYEDYKINKVLLKMSSFGSKIGITRFFPSIANDSAAIQYGTLTDEEKDLYRAVFYRRTLTRSMYNEVISIKSNATKVNENNIADIPMLLFISNGQGTGWDSENWIDIQSNFVDNLSKGESIKLACSHYVHDIEYEKISKESDRFIRDLINTN